MSKEELMIRNAVLVALARQSVRFVPVGISARHVHLSQADLETLCLLPGVGEVKAQRILEYRQKHGPFASLQELDQVEGIGPKTIESWEGLAWVS